MLRAAVAGMDTLEAFSLLLLLDFFSDVFSSSAAFSVGLLELSGGVEGFDDDRRRWWLGLKGCCAVLIAARPIELVGTTVMALVERKALPSAGENMASCGGVVLVVLMEVGRHSESCCKAVTLETHRSKAVRGHESGQLRES